MNDNQEKQDALHWKIPGGHFMVNSVTGKVDWFDTTRPMPTEEEIEQIISEWREYRKSTEYSRLRAYDYPDIREQLDAIWKGGDSMETMRLRIKETKEKFPKPS